MEVQYGNLFIIAGFFHAQELFYQIFCLEQNCMRIKLVKFQKINGAQGELQGFKIYALEFDAEIEFTENCKWVTGFMESALSFQTTKAPPQDQGGMAGFMEASQNPGQIVNKGQRVQLAGVVRFVKKEKGWSAERVELSRATLAAGSGSSSSSKETADVKSTTTTDGNDAKEFVEYRTKAMKGDANAQYKLGKMYNDGRGVETNYVEALRWYQASADQQNALGQNALGWMYNNGVGVEQNEAEAIKWFRKSAEQGEAKGQDNLGLSYINGWGVGEDKAEGAKWIRKAAEQGLDFAQNTLGYLYLNGIGVTKDETQGAKWYQKAAGQGFSRAQFNLGELYENGKGVPRNRDTAVDWYRKAAKAGIKEAKIKLRELSPSPAEAADDCANNLAEIFYTVITYPFKENQLPSNFQFIMEKLKQYESDGTTARSAKIFFCPSDKNTLEKRTTLTNCSAIKVTDIHYQMLSGTFKQGDRGKVYVKCPIHGLLLYADGTIITSDGIELELGATGWADKKSIADKKDRADVMYDLRIIDSAKDLWAIEENKRDGQSPTEDDLKPHLSPRGRFPVHPTGGRYIINPVGQSPKSTAYGAYTR